MVLLVWLIDAIYASRYEVRILTCESFETGSERRNWKATTRIMSGHDKIIMGTEVLRRAVTEHGY